LIDLRELLGMQSAPQERTAFREMLQQREQDHKHWLDELAACVLEVRPFTLATDPTQCAFGKWYGGYHPPNISVSSLVHKMDAPHRAIHAIARQATELVAAGKTTEAQALIERTRTTALAALLPLFAELSRLIDETDREVCVVLGTGVKRVAVAVDAVESVERFAAGSETSLDHVPGLSASGLAQSIGRRAHGNGLVTILDIDRLLRTDVENMNCNWSEVQPAA
jgi:purine-binding chemotaxis protein CheW